MSHDTSCPILSHQAFRVCRAELHAIRSGRGCNDENVVLPSLQCAELLEELNLADGVCQASNTSRWLRMALSPCMQSVKKICSTKRYLTWRWRACHIQGALQDMQKMREYRSWPKSTFDTLGLNHTLSSIILPFAMEALKWRGCCDWPLTLQARGLMYSRPKSVRSLLLASSVFDCAGGHLHLQSWRLRHEANLLQVHRAVAANCRWKLKPLFSRATILYRSFAIGVLRAMPRIYGNALLRGLHAKFDDRESMLLALHDITLAWDESLGTVFLMDEAKCETYSSDHSPDEHHAYAFSGKILAAPIVHSPCWAGDGVSNDSREVLMIFSLTEVDSSYYHFLTELASKLAWVHRRGWPETNFSRLLPLLLPPGSLSASPGSSFLKELIDLLGVPVAQMRSYDGPYRCLVQTLYVPSWSRIVHIRERPIDMVYHPPAVQLVGVRSLLLQSSNKAIQRPRGVLVVNRENAHKRQALGLDKIIGSVTSYDLFEPGTLKQQARDFAEHHLVISPWGAALANLIFSPADGAAVILPMFPWNEHYLHIAAVMKTEGLLTGGLHVISTAFASHAGDFHLDPQNCRDLLVAVIKLIHVSLSEQALANCLALAQPSRVHICGSGPTDCLDWGTLLEKARIAED